MGEALMVLLTTLLALPQVSILVGIKFNKAGDHSWVMGGGAGAGGT